MVVVVIIGILATLAITSFFRPTENAHEREAQANLKLVAAAEKIYRLETGTYIGLGSATAINQALRLTLPVDNRQWTYSVAATTNTFTVDAIRQRGETPKTFRITEAVDEPWRL
jgi:type II secretory pathway pseudopilin PulG